MRDSFQRRTGSRLSTAYSEGEFHQVIFAELQSALDAGHLMCASIGDNSDTIAEVELSSKGLDSLHAYSVLGMTTLDDSSLLAALTNRIDSLLGTRLIRIYNPWGHGGYKGDYGPHTQTTWPRELREKLLGREGTPQRAGDSWMPFDDFLRYFHNVTVSFRALLSFANVALCRSASWAPLET